MKQGFLALIDFSAYSPKVLLVAHHWSRWAGAELHVLSDVVDFPSMGAVEPGVREAVIESFREDARSRLAELAGNVLGDEASSVKLHVSAKRLLFETKKICKDENIQLIFTGLKGHGFLTRILIGSTVVKLIESIDIPVVAVPKHYQPSPEIDLTVGVTYHYPIGKPGLSRFLELLNGKIASVTFMSVVTKEDDELQATRYLQDLASEHSKKIETCTKIFKGADAFSEVKAGMQQERRAVLLVQKGSRALKDYLFRRFTINELVYDGAIPLIILP